MSEPRGGRGNLSPLSFSSLFLKGNHMAKSPAAEALAFAEKVAKTAKTGTELHNAIFGIGGKASALFPTESARTAFAGTDEYKRIWEIIRELRGARPGSPPAEEFSGKLMVRLPKTLHAALHHEAEREGVSLNQLILAKVSIDLAAMV